MVRTNFMMAPFTPIIGREKNQKWELDFYDGTYYNYDNKIIEHRGVIGVYDEIYPFEPYMIFFVHESTPHDDWEYYKKRQEFRWYDMRRDPTKNYYSKTFFESFVSNYLKSHLKIEIKTVPPTEENKLPKVTVSIKIDEETVTSDTLNLNKQEKQKEND